LDVYKKLIKVGERAKTDCSELFLREIGSKLKIAGSKKNLNLNFGKQISEKKFKVDLTAIAVFQMGSLGIPLSNINILDEDTFININYFSYRRDKASANRNFSWIARES
jgi:copper oxidase (laccase) domain-containing protein